MATENEFVEYGGQLYKRMPNKGYIRLIPVVDGKPTRKYGTVAEHRVVYETYHNVKLPDNFVVHHLNRDRMDNRPENLIALSIDDHTRLHGFEDRNYDVDNLCLFEIEAFLKKVPSMKDVLAERCSVSDAVSEALSKLVAYDGQIYHVTSSNGYNMLYPVVDGKVDYTTRIPEHKLVYELAHDVALPDGVMLRHVNHVRDDNRPENIVLVDKRFVKDEPDEKHVRRKAKEKSHCAACGKEITSGAVMCAECYGKQRVSVTDKVTKDELTELIKTMSNCAIAKMYGVSDTAVKKWRRGFGLPSANEQHGWHKGPKCSCA